MRLYISKISYSLHIFQNKKYIHVKKNGSLRHISIWYIMVKILMEMLLTRRWLLFGWQYLRINSAFVLLIGVRMEYMVIF